MDLGLIALVAVILIIWYIGIFEGAFPNVIR